MADSGEPAVYASADVELFDLDQFTHTSDQRSVGELLHEADRQARTMLMDVTGDDAARLLHAWATLVSAAGNLWQALPRPPGLAAESAIPIDRVAEISDSLSRRLTTNSWPPPTAPDPRMSDMAHTLDRATSLVERFAGENVLGVSGVKDLQAARARIMHTLYVAAHAVTVSLVQYGRARHDQAAATRRPLATPARQTPYAVAPTTEWVRRMAAAEAAAASFATHGQLPALLNGEELIPPADTSRLSRALASWDVQAHRGLVSPAWRDNMVLTTRTQALICGSAMLLVSAAGSGHKPDPPSRLGPALGRAGAAWSDLGSRWDDLTAPNVRPSPQLIVAAGEIRAATRELIHDAATVASPHTIAGRPGFDEGLQAVLRALEHADELAHAVAEKGTTPGLTGRARALSIRAHDDIDAGRATIPVGRDTVWVSPTDILAKHIVAAPPPVAEGLQASSQAVVQAATLAGAAASSVAGSRPPAQAHQAPLGGRGQRQPENPPTSMRAAERLDPTSARA